MTRKIGTIRGASDKSKNALVNAGWWVALTVVMATAAFFLTGEAKAYFSLAAAVCAVFALVCVATFSEEKVKAAVRLHQSLEGMGLTNVRLKDGGQFTATFLEQTVKGDIRQESTGKASVWIDLKD